MKFSAGGDQVFASYSGDNIYSFLSTDHARASEAYCEAQGLSRCHLDHHEGLHGALHTAHTTRGPSHFESCFVHTSMYMLSLLKPVASRRQCAQSSLMGDMVWKVTVFLCRPSSAFGTRSASRHAILNTSADTLSNGRAQEQAAFQSSPNHAQYRGNGLQTGMAHFKGFDASSSTDTNSACLWNAQHEQSWGLYPSALSALLLAMSRYMM